MGIFSTFFHVFPKRLSPSKEAKRKTQDSPEYLYETVKDMPFYRDKECKPNENDNN